MGTKPDPEIYQRALRRLGVDAAMTMYIGDGGDDELVGAERAGLRVFRAAWFVRDSPQKATWPELTDPQDVLKLVTAGEHALQPTARLHTETPRLSAER